MNNQLLSNIEKSSAGFSKGQRLIAQYIERHYDKAAFMTASRLGATVGVSESTVVRFATEIGYEGYPALQKAMQEMIRSKLTSLQRIEVTNERIGRSDLLDAVLNADMDTIRNTLDEVSREEFRAAVETIVSARRIYIVAARSAAPVASFLAYYFNMIFENVIAVNAASESAFFEKMFRIDEKDAVIGFSFPRYSSSVAKALRFASDKGAAVISVTDSPASPLAVYAKHLLLARSDMVSIVDSLVAPLSLVNALIVAVASRKKEDVSEAFCQLEHVWDEYDVYEKVEDRAKS
ncbi:MAG: MurR/RpiR family transcriptional regulator [Firmicutes bacterium]|nr:MurR/RpiR family transcriptional regulator [Bacillota bacterium]